jgi:peptide/nickel transport system substrate-binding protein
VVSFKAYHEYVNSQFVYAPIYQPTQSFAYSESRLSMPESVRGIRLTVQSILDIGVK